jgi:hypothetical protein
MSAKVKTGEEPPSVDSKSSVNKSGDDASASKRSSNKSSSKGSSSSRSSSKSSSSSRSSGSGSDKGSSRSGSSSKQKKLKKVKVKKTKSGSGSRSSSHSGSDSGVSASGSKKKPEDDKESKGSQDDEQSPDKKSDAKENFFAQNRKEMKDDGRSMNLDGLMAKLEEVAKNLKNAKSSLADEGDGLWKDEDFPPINKSLAKDDDKLKEIKAPYKSNIKWMRPQTISKDVKFAVTEFSKCDLKFGQTSDAVFTSALGLLAIHANIENIFVDVENIFTMGYAVFQFFKNGEWRYVIVDTFIPYSPEKKTTLYSECGEPNECWVQLVEKAYAKLNGCYQNIQGMDICEVLVDLTGGVADKEEIDSEKYKEAKDAKDSTETAVLYSRIKSFISNKYILGCIKHVPSRHASAKENGDRGIYENLYYGMLGIWEVGLVLLSSAKVRMNQEDS